MNAAYLMLTTAWLAGADPVPAAPAAPAAPIVVGQSNCGGCGGGYVGGGNACCDDPCGKKPGLFARLFAKKGGDCGCDSCNTCDRAPKCREPRAPKCKAPREPKCRAPKNDCCNSCNTCDDPCANRTGRRGLLARLFNKGDDCGCDSGCGCGTASSGCGCGNGQGGTIISAPAGAPTGAPPEAAPPPKAAPGKTTALPMNGIVRPVVVAAPY